MDSINEIIKYHILMKLARVSDKRSLALYKYLCGNICLNDLNMLRDKEVLNEEEYERLREVVLSGGVIQELETAQKKGISIITMESDSYPELLKTIPDPPNMFYALGNLKSCEHCVAIVGARTNSEYGANVAKKLGASLAAKGINVVSGLARGIDRMAHIGALSEGYTTAVLGCGVDVCYPRGNIDLYEEIKKKGCIISEMPLNTPPIAYNFPIRNRIISGLCESVVVVEAKDKSGSLITADQALEQGRDVYAVPGRIGDVLSYGCNRLIEMGAGIITDIEAFAREVAGINEEIIYLDEIKIGDEARRILEFIDTSPTALEVIIQKSGCSMIEVLRLLWELEDAGIVSESSKNYYVRKL